MKFFWSRPSTADKAQQFCRDVDATVKKFGLNPELPEVVDLKARANEIVQNEHERWYLGFLDPSDSVEHSSGCTIVHERPYGYVLKLWSIARHYHPDLDTTLTKIIADEQGTALYTTKPNQPVALFHAGTINPRRLADPGNRYQIACAVIHEFTGHELDYRDHVGITQRITADKDTAGSWTIRTFQLAR